MFHQKSIIMVADDDSDDQILIEDALRETGFNGKVHCVSNGVELMNYLQNDCPCPSLILLDLNMPEKDGREALQEIKSDPHLRHIPVIIHSTSSSEQDITFCYRHGVNSYVTKPATFEELKRNLNALLAYWFNIAVLP